MKRIMVVCLVLTVLMGVSATAFAAPNGFVASPSGSQAPTLEDFTPKDEHCIGNLVITSYGDRQTLPTDLRERFEEAYNTIRNAKDLTDLNADLEKLAAEKKIDPENLEVRDLFHGHIEGCDYHDGHIIFDVTLGVNPLDNFVGLLYMNEDGEWELIETELSDDGKHLSFTIRDINGPFAIVVDTTSNSPGGPTGESNAIYIYTAVMILSALALVILIVLYRKRETAE